jgi:AcrR family transcriptional regulator
MTTTSPEDRASTPGNGEPGPRGRPPKSDSAPRGPDGVRRATIRAATALFAERGIAAVSVREIAAEAGVNAALVHRYVGGKPVVLRAVMDALVDELKQDLEPVMARELPLIPERIEELMRVHQRILAHIAIEGLDVRDYQTEFPVVAFVMQQIQERDGVDERAARVRTAQIFALDMAVRLFEPLLLMAAGLTMDDREDLARLVRSINTEIGAGP